MKVYLHQLWLVLMFLLLLAGLFLPIAQYENVEGSTALLTNFRLKFVEGDSVSAMWALGVILCCTALLMLLLSVYRNFTLQKRLLIFDDLLIVGYYIVYVVYVILLNDDAVFRPKVAAGFPLIALLLSILTFSCIQRVEAAIISGASSFRLR